MELLDNLGISYEGDYMAQGSLIDKCKKSSKLGIKNIELIVRNDGKDTDYKSVSSSYNGNVLLHIPSINVSQSNLKDIKDFLSTSLSDNIKTIVIDASTLLYDTYEWSTVEEQQNYLRNIAKGIASLMVFDKEIAIENTTYYKDNMLFGKSVSNMSDLLVYVRNILVEENSFTREKAAQMVGVSLNIRKLFEVNEISHIDRWFRTFYNDLKCIKVDDVEKNIKIIAWLVDAINLNKLDCKILYGTKSEIEDINNVYNKFEYIIKNKIEGKELSFNNYQNIAQSKYNEFSGNFTSAQSGYTNLIIIIMILLTVIAGVLMFIIKCVT